MTNSKNYTVYLDKDIVDQARIRAGKESLSLSRVINKLLKAYGEAETNMDEENRRGLLS